MNKEVIKSLVFIFVLIGICAVFVRVLTGQETLSEYAAKKASQTPLEAVDEVSKNNIQESQIEATEATTEAIVKTQVEESTVESTISNEQAVTSSTINPDDSSIVMYHEGFSYESLPQNVIDQITGISYPADDSTSEIKYSDLRYLQVQYHDFSGTVQTGELICNKAIANDLIEIFYELYLAEYQIDKMNLIDEYNGDDDASCLDDNTSCFNYRVVEGSTHLSMHAYGLAIDINPFYNPYITYNADGSENISPVGSEDYANRSNSFPYKIDTNDLCYQLFIQHGFTWGGNWNSCKDYQHFQKKL